MGVIHLVRHGQASFGADNYDELSPLGYQQADLVGNALSDRGIRPDRVVHGGLQRQRATAETLIEAAGFDAPLLVDGRWAEFDHQGVISAYHPDWSRASVMNATLQRMPDPRAAFHKELTAANERWMSGQFSDYRESFTEFWQRALAALQSVADEGGTSIVVTSGGVIGVVAAALLAGEQSAWPRANSIVVNTSITKILSGARGLTLSSFNDHGHLEHDRSVLTYR